MRLLFKVGAAVILLVTVLNVVSFVFFFQSTVKTTDDTHVISGYHKLQALEESHRQLQQEHEEMIVNHKRLQQRTLEIEEGSLNRLKDLNVLHEQLVDAYTKENANALQSANALQNANAIQNANGFQNMNGYQNANGFQSANAVQQSGGVKPKPKPQKRKRREEAEDVCRDIVDDIISTWEAMEVHYGYRDHIGVGSHQTPAVTKLTKKSAPIPRRDGRTFTFEDYYQNFVKTERPVVITNYYDRMYSTNWTLSHMAKHCAGQEAALKKYDPEATTWANLAPVEDTTVDRFVERVLSGEAKDEYLFDFSIPYSCPTLLREFTVPKYFAQDYLQRVPDRAFDEERTYKGFWPSLFIGTGNTQSGLHVDAIQSHFWMGLIEGHKRWAVVNRDEIPFLYPTPNTKNFGIGSLFTMNVTQFPLASKATVWETVLGPGEVLYVPGGSAHEVRNLDTILAISMNYLDEYNLERAIGYLNGELAGVRNYFMNPKFIHAVPSDQKDLPWKKYKTWPRSDEVYDMN